MKNPKTISDTHRTARQVAETIAARVQESVDPQTFAELVVRYAHESGRPYVHLGAVGPDTVWLSIEVEANWINRFDRIYAGQALKLLKAT